MKKRIKRRTLAFAHCRPAEILAERKRTSLLWLPLGPLEWHGPHLPLGTDPFNAESAAYDCARRMGGLVLPTLFCGTERERGPATLRNLGLNPSTYIVGMDFPNNSLLSGYFPEEEFALQLKGWIERAIDWEFRTLIVMNGHGALNHNEVVKRMVVMYSAKGSPIDVLAFLPLVAASDGGLNVGHATADETSLILLDYPEDVCLAALPPKNRSIKSAEFAVVDDPTFNGNPLPDHRLRKSDDPRFHANAKRAKNVRQRTVRYTCEQVKSFQSGCSTRRFNLSLGMA